MSELKPSRFDGMWGREIRANAEKERMKKGLPTPRPWRWLPDEGNFIVAAEDLIVAEVPCTGGNPADGAFIVEAVNAYDARTPADSEVKRLVDRELREVPEGVIRVADRRTVEFDRARALAAKLEIK